MYSKDDLEIAQIWGMFIGFVSALTLCFILVLYANQYFVENIKIAGVKQYKEQLVKENRGYYVTNTAGEQIFIFRCE